VLPGLWDWDSFIGGKANPVSPPEPDNNDMVVTLWLEDPNPQLPTGTIIKRVISSDTGAPVEGVHVTLTGPGGPLEADTGPTGTVEFDGLDAGNYTLTVHSPAGWTPPTITHNITLPDPDPGPGTDPWLWEQTNKITPPPPPPGQIIKRVLHFWWQEPVRCVRVTLTGPSGPKDARTNCQGTVVFADLPAGDYVLTVYAPCGWLPKTIVHKITLHDGETWARDNYIYDGCGRCPHTIGFWKHWRCRYTCRQMQALIARVKTGSGDFAGLSLCNIDAALNTSGPKTCDRMARIQYLALWLNLASERLGFSTQVNIRCVRGWNTIIVDNNGILTMHDLMLQMRELFNGGTMTPKQWEIFKNICDAINNGNCC